ncbi:sensor histidine kinase [Flavilitoribacter nigricans]|nr:histidine kinase [Flavilitoribacter nigricans]
MEDLLFSKNKWIRLGLHTAFWLIHLLLFTVLSNAPFGSAIQEQLLSLPFKMLPVYIVFYALFPRYLLRRSYLRFFIFSTLVVMVFAALQSRIMYLIHAETSEEAWSWMWVVSSIILNAYILALALALKLLRFWHQREKYIQELSHARLEAELKFLKAQVHPHFLFNTLNNLYTLTLRKSDHAPEVVEKLSDLLRYMSYDANHRTVPLSNEIEYLRNYISLEKIRYGEKLEIAFTRSDLTDGLQIAPLILIPFVENSFKHGVSGRLTACWITIHLSVQGEQLTFKVENSLPSSQEDVMGYKEGIGLKNVKRRLDLIYPERHELRVTQSPESHLIVLKIDLGQ